jgi:hypothetical protein
MQLVVPVEDSSSGSGSAASTSNRCSAGRLTATGAVGTDANINQDLDNNNDDDILSDELRDQFETMKSVWRRARRGDRNGGSSSSSSNSINEEDAETKERRRAMIRKDLKRKERETALETAIKVDNEINQWRNGIADLEALLAAEDSDMDEDDELRVGQQNNGPPGVREIAFVVRNNNNRQHQQHIINPPAFPFLPPMIPPEDGLLDDEDN